MKHLQIAALPAAFWFGFAIQQAFFRGDTDIGSKEPTPQLQRETMPWVGGYVEPDWTRIPSGVTSLSLSSPWIDDRDVWMRQTGSSNPPPGGRNYYRCGPGFDRFCTKDP